MNKTVTPVKSNYIPEEKWAPMAPEEIKKYQKNWTNGAYNTKRVRGNRVLSNTVFENEHRYTQKKQEAKDTAVVSAKQDEVGLLKKNLCDPRVKESDQLFLDISGIKYLVDMGAEISTTVETIGQTGIIHVQSYDGEVKEKNLGYKHGIKMISGAENLLAAKDLKKILRLKEVNQQEELSRIEKGMIGSKLAKAEIMEALRKTPFGESKNDCGKVSEKSAHKIEGRIHKPQRQYPINKKGWEELTQTMKELEEQGMTQEIKGDVTNSPIQLIPKPDATFRLVTNFKALNRVTKPDRRYLINARDMTEKK